MNIFKTTCKSHGILYNIEEYLDYFHKFEDENGVEQLVMSGVE